MATINIDDGNVYVTNGTLSGNIITITGTQVCVRISTQKIEHDFTNAPITIDIATTTNSQESQTGTTKESKSFVYDLLRWKETLTVTGLLEDESTESAYTKKINLVKLKNYGGSITVVWGKTTGTGQQSFPRARTDGSYDQTIMGKMKISEAPEIYSSDLGDTGFTSITPAKGFDVVIQLFIGVDKAEG